MHTMHNPHRTHRSHAAHPVRRLSLASRIVSGSVLLLGIIAAVGYVAFLPPLFPLSFPKEQVYAAVCCLVTETFSALPITLVRGAACNGGTDVYYTLPSTIPYGYLSGSDQTIYTLPTSVTYYKAKAAC